MKIGQHTTLRHKRQLLNLKQKDVARELGIPQSTLCHYENGTEYVKLGGDRIAALAAFYAKKEKEQSE